MPVIELPDGDCKFCGQTYTRAGMTRHLKACDARKKAIADEEGKPAKIYHLRVEATYIPHFWMNVEITGNKQLKDLDRFLRDTWVECCGHLSAFYLDGDSYSSYPDKSFGDKSMTKKLNTVLSDDSEFRYEYDFGTTTYLSLRVIDVREGQAKPKSDVEILARNQLPELICIECETNPATEICTDCYYSREEGGFLCDDCIDDHEHGEDYLLPVVNSPRMGECGYAG